MNYWLTGIITVLVGIFGSTGFWCFLQNRTAKKSVERKMLLAVAFIGVKMSCKCCLDRGYATTEEIEDIEKYLYEPYKDLGGNGTAEMLMDKVKALPNKPLEKGA